MNTSFSRLLKYGIKGGAIAVILNLIIFEIALRVFGLEFDVVMGGSAMKVAEVNVIFASFIPSLIGTVIYFILLKKTKNPEKTFIILAIIALALSFYNPFSAAEHLSVKLVLSLLHIIAAFEITKSLVHDSKRPFFLNKAVVN